MTPTARQVIARRRRDRELGLAEACDFARGLDPALGVDAVVVVGSFARGDFHDHSDIDVLVVATQLPDHPGERLRALDWPRPGRVEPVVWTPDDHRSQLAKGDPIAVEAATDGVVVGGGLPE